MNKEPEKSSFKDLLYIATALLLIVGIVISRSVASKSNQPLVVAATESVESPASSGVAEIDERNAHEETIDGEGKLNLQNFRDLTRTALGKLVPVKRFKDLQAQELHAMPEIMQESAVLLGQVAQALHDNPALATEANTFYEDCFRQKDLPSQIRGLCLANHRNLRVKIGEGADWSSVESEMPADVLRLANFIPIN